MSRPIIFVTLAVAALLAGCAHLKKPTGSVAIDLTYSGPFHEIGRNEDGNTMYFSEQSNDDRGGGPLGLQALGVTWVINDANEVEGKATFISVDTGETLSASIKGTASDPAPGQSYIEVAAGVTFAGGTGLFTGATGVGEALVRLSDEGIASGRLTGTVELAESQPSP